MRVLHIGKFYPPFAGGMENFVADLLPVLNQAGVNIKILVHNHLSISSIATHEPYSFVCRVPCYGSFMYAPISPKFPLVLKKIIQSFTPDILHIHMPNTSAFWVLLLQCAKQIPWIVHWHSDVAPSDIDRRISIAYKLYRPFEQNLLKQAKTIITTSPLYLKSSIPLYRWKNKCRVVPLGLNPIRLVKPDISLNRLSEKIWGYDQNAKVLAIGRLTYYKGHEILIKAAALLPNIKVIIIGQGKRKRALQKLINELRLEKRVKLIGFMEETKLHAMISSCDCLCLPSIERTEAFGLVLLEAMCYAKPVVVSDVPGSGMSWVVQHNETGFIVPFGSPEKLAQALSIMIQEPQLRNNMGNAAKTRFNAFFQINQIAQDILSLYQDILK